jgi:hypothetical protein
MVVILRKRRLLYLDVDGVLLGKAKPDDIQICLAKHSVEFLKYCLNHFECYWFTTQCKDGDTTNVLALLGRYAENAVMKLATKIKPVKWVTLKTKVIDSRTSFYIVDDQLLWSETEWLKQHNLLERWIQVDTRKNPDDLKRAVSELETRLGMV